jgi:glucose uptake protein GlcU
MAVSLNCLSDYFLTKRTKMEELTLTTPALLFSAISLILLAYTNRFLAYASVVRNLHAQFKKDPTRLLLGQINNLRKRLQLTRSMQILGISSLLLCVLCMFLIYVEWQTTAEVIFGIALVLLITSLALSVREIQISVRALDLHLSDMEGLK